MLASKQTKKDGGYTFEEIKLFVIGATGAGKSSLINLFYIWSKKLRIEDLKDLQELLIKTSIFKGDASAERNVENQGESQTDFPKEYTFEIEDNTNKIKYRIRFLDTPGLGDTRGMDQDEKNLDGIIETVAATEGLNAILLTMNGSNPRINSQVKYVMTKLQGMIPDVLQQNLFVLLTNVDLKPNLKIEQVLDFPLDKKRVFCYNNQIFTLEREDFDDENMLFRVRQSYQFSIEILTRLFKAVSDCSVKPTQEFRLLKYGRDLLKTKLASCNEAETNIHNQKSKLESVLADINNGNVTLSELQKQLFRTETEEYWEAENTPSHNTTCMTCKHSCHQNCGLNENNIQGSALFKSCAAFGGSEYCRQCGHHYGSHVHLRQKYVKKTRSKSIVNSQTQNEINLITDQKAQKENTINTINKQVALLNQRLEDLHVEVQSLVFEMKEVCSRFDYIKEIEACVKVLDEQIEITTSQASSLKSTDEVSSKLASLKKTKQSMKILLDGLRKTLNQGNLPPKKSSNGILDWIKKQLA
jgi:GTPase SAR1 family protein